MARIPSSWNKAFDEESGLALIDDLEASLIAAAGEKQYLVEGDVERYFDAKYGKAGTDDALKSFQSEIDQIQGRGK